MNELRTYYDNMRRNSELTYKHLCRKFTVLFTLLGWRRKQWLLVIETASVFLQTDKAFLLPNQTLKHNNQTLPVETLAYHSFTEDENCSLLVFKLRYRWIKQKICCKSGQTYILQRRLTMYSMQMFKCKN